MSHNATEPITTPDAVLEEILTARYGCRSFRSDPVPTETITRMFTLAQRTASWCNSQAWQVELVSGERTQAFAEALTRRVSTTAQAPDIAPPARYEGVYQERRRGAGYGLYNALGIDRGDHERRGLQMLENFRFFGAPHVAIISTPHDLGTYGAVDCGAYVSTLLTAAQSLGVATIAQAAIAMYSDFVREYLDLPVDRDIVCAVSFGYADDEHPANGFRTERSAVSEVVKGLA